MEPTNDLDIETLNVLEDVLDGWPGTLVVVSHDRWFLERVTDAVWALLGDGRLVQLPGGVEEYLARRAAMESSAAPGALAPGATPTASSGTGAGPASSARSSAQARAARKELARLERDLERLERRRAVLHDDLAAHATDHVKAAELHTALQALDAEVAETESRWLELADEG